MKPGGCFVKILIVSTIVIAAVVYVFTNKFDEYIKTPVQNFVIEFALGDVKDELKSVADSKAKEELISTIDNFSNDVRGLESINYDKLQVVAVNLSKIMEDKVISQSEVVEIKSIIEEVLQNEK